MIRAGGNLTIAVNYCLCSLLFFLLPSLALSAPKYQNPYNGSNYDTGNDACASVATLFGDSGFTVGACNGSTCFCEKNGAIQASIQMVCETSDGSIIGYNENSPDCQPDDSGTGDGSGDGSGEGEVSETIQRVAIVEDETIDAEIVGAIVGGSLLLFVVGLGIGLIIQTIRRLKL